MRSISERFPFEREVDGHHSYVTFVTDADVLDELAAPRRRTPGPDEKIERGEGVVYWQVPNKGTLDTTIGKTMGKKRYKSSTTTRNLRTIEKVLAVGTFGRVSSEPIANADGAVLTGVSETALLTLQVRANEARRADSIIDDPMAIQLVDSIDFEWAKFGYSRRQDMAVRRWPSTPRRAATWPTTRRPPWWRWRRVCKPASIASTPPGWDMNSAGSRSISRR